jgi:release factor glutamine methyltransferase
MNALPDVQQALVRACDTLNKAKQVSDTLRLDAELLLAHVMEKDRTWLYTWSDKSLTLEQWQKYQALIAERSIGQPVAYLIGYREFWGLELKVSPDTLIPRADTETLVEVVLDLLPQPEATVADLGTGTGAIALALASEKPRWDISACDFQAGAVALAEDNRQNLGFDHVKVFQSDWCQALKDSHYDLIVSNPPYIEAADPHLKQGDVRFEPLSALTSGDDGLEDIREICRQTRLCLKSSGWLVLEHGYNQAESVQQIMLEHGFEQVRSVKDLAGQDRVTLGCTS